MNNPHKNWQKFLINEAGLNKIRQDMLDYDTAFITAFRGDYDDVSMCVYVPPSEEELNERDKMGKREYEIRETIENSQHSFLVKVMVSRIFKALTLKTLDLLTQRNFQEK